MSPVNKVSVHLLALMIFIANPLAAIQVYNFCRASDNKIIFRSSLRNVSKFEYEMYYGHLDCLFHKNEEAIGHQCLKAGQVKRFTVIANNTEDELMVTLIVRNVRKEDEGLYILLVAGGREDEKHVDVTEAYIDVVTPPGPVECENVSSSYSQDWIEVHCSAPIGMDSDPQGSLACFQNGKKSSYMSQPEHSADRIKAVFWMDVESSINCCSLASQCEKSPEKCRDFTYFKVFASMSSDENDPQAGGETTSQQSATRPQTMIYNTQGLFNNGQHSNAAVLAPILGSTFLGIFAVIILIFVKRSTSVCKGHEKFCIIGCRDRKSEARRVNMTVISTDIDKSTGSPMLKD